eukprot:1156505-Pelagomonas_calceolata.AAC.6
MQGKCKIYGVYVWNWQILYIAQITQQDQAWHMTKPWECRVVFGSKKERTGVVARQKATCMKVPNQQASKRLSK